MAEKSGDQVDVDPALEAKGQQYIMADQPRADREMGAVLIAVNSYCSDASYCSDPEHRLYYADRVLKGYIETFYRYLFFQVDVLVDFSLSDFQLKFGKFITWCQQHEMGRVAVVLYGHGGIVNGKECVFTEIGEPLEIAELEVALHSHFPKDNKYLFIDACRELQSGPKNIREHSVFQVSTGCTARIRSTLLFNVAISNTWSECFAMKLRNHGTLVAVVNTVDDNMKEKFDEIRRKLGSAKSEKFDEIRRTLDSIDGGYQKSEILLRGVSDDPSFRGAAKACNPDGIRKLPPYLQERIECAEQNFKAIRNQRGLPPKPMLAFLDSPSNSPSKQTAPRLGLPIAQDDKKKEPGPSGSKRSQPPQTTSGDKQLQPKRCKSASEELSSGPEQTKVNDMAQSQGEEIGSVLIAVNSYAQAANKQLETLHEANQVLSDYIHTFHRHLFFKVSYLFDYTLETFEAEFADFCKKSVGHHVVVILYGHGGICKGREYQHTLGARLFIPTLEQSFAKKCPNQNRYLLLDICRKTEEGAYDPFVYQAHTKGILVVHSTLTFHRAERNMWSRLLAQYLRNVDATLDKVIDSVDGQIKLLHPGLQQVSDTQSKGAKGTPNFKLMANFANESVIRSLTENLRQGIEKANRDMAAIRPTDNDPVEMDVSLGNPAPNNPSNLPSAKDQQTMQPSTTPVEDQRTLALRKAHEQLKRFYTRPVKSNMPGKAQFINLALVERLINQSKTRKVLKDFLEATAYGIDRYSLKQKNIEYKAILTRTGSDSGKRVLISGPPGSGKTTLARKLCRDLYSGDLLNQYQLVLFTELKAFRSYTNKKNKEASLRTLLEYSGFDDTASSLCSMIKEEEGSGVAIILDGYDEISDDELLSEWASDVFTCPTPLLRVSQCDVFITTRPSQLPQLTKDAPVHLEVLGFSNSDIEYYIKVYFEGAPDRAKKVIQRLTNPHLVRGLCSNPRVLQIACKVLNHLDDEPLPANLSGIFLRYLCYQLEVDLTQRQRLVETRIKPRDLLNISEELFPGFHTLCSLAYDCCLCQQLMLEKQELGEVKNYISSRGSVYNLLFGEKVDSPSEMLCVLYQCDHKTVMEALAAVHIAVLSLAKQQKIWEEWFTAPHMAQVWMMYCGLTGLKSVDLRRLCFLAVQSERSREVLKDLKAWALDDEDKLVMVSLFEADNDEEAKRVLPVLLKNTIRGCILSQYDVLVLAYSIRTRHPHLSKWSLHLPEDCSELDLEPLTTSLKNVKAVELRCEEMEPMLTVLPRAVEKLSLHFGFLERITYEGLGDALRECHRLQSLRIEARKYNATLWTELNSVLNSSRLTELNFKNADKYDRFSLGKVVPYSMEALKNLLVHREKCSLKMRLNDLQISALLSGLKRADKLKELDLNIINLSISEVNPNQCLLTCAEVEDLVATHPHLVKVDVNSSPDWNGRNRDILLTVVKGTVRHKNVSHLGLGDDERDDLLLAVVKGAVRNKNVSHLGLGRPAEVPPHIVVMDAGHCRITRAVRPLLCSPSADHITSIRACYGRGLCCCGLDDDDDDDAWSKSVIEGPMARQTCHLDLKELTPASFGLLLSRLNTATKLKDLSLKVTNYSIRRLSQWRVNEDSIEDHNPVDVLPVETAFMNCNLRKLRIEALHDDRQPTQWCCLYSAILNGLAANTTAQVDSCFYRFGSSTESSFDVKEITRPLSQQTLQRFEVVKTASWSYIISRDPSCSSAPVPAPGPLLNTPSEPTSPKPETTPPGQTTPTHQTTSPDPTTTPPADVGELLRKYKDRIYSEVKSRPISLRLLMEKVIDERVALEISTKTDHDGNCLIYLHLMGQGDLKSLQTFGTVLAEEEGNAKMQRLGKDLLAEITLPHGSS